MSSSSTEFSGSAIALLKADHHGLLERFERFFALRHPQERQQEWRALSEALKRHMAIEAEVFYPAFLDATEDSLLHFVASVGHEKIAAEMQDVLEGPAASTQLASRVRAVKNVFMHHVSDMERDGGMFEEALRSGINHEMLNRLVRAHYASLATVAGEGSAPIDHERGQL
jgi:hypothetical protein